jgi:succinate dehydrogenase/fumarate reductase cytochrome b subunit (b558 family)
VSEESSAKSLFDKSRRPYLMRKLHSLSGVLPVGAFMCFHLWENAKALKGQAEFDETVAGIGRMPYLWALEIFGIILPLVFHAVYGVIIALRGKPNVGYYTYSRNWMYALQRVTGVLAFLFIGYHLYEYRWQKLTGKLGPEQFYAQLCANMSSTIGPVPVVALIYILGIAACVFHFANGLWGFCFSWGLTVSRRSQQMAATVFGLVGVVVFLLGANTAIYFATGSRFPDAAWEKIFGAAETKGGVRTCADVAYAARTQASVQ